MRVGGAAPVGPRHEDDPGPHDIGDGRAELPGRRDRALQRSERLGAAVARVERRAVRAERRRPADDDPRPGAHGAGVGGGLLEAAALPDLPADQPRNVTVLSVEIFPLPSFCQIS